jgi:hypothetical protein
MTAAPRFCGPAMPSFAGQSRKRALRKPNKTEIFKRRLQANYGLINRWWHGGPPVSASKVTASDGYHGMLGNGRI